MHYTTKGVCSRAIDVEVDDNGIITAATITGGCPGNTQGLCKLAVGRPADEIIRLCEGTRCGAKPTSCPDQLAQALKLALAQR